MTCLSVQFRHPIYCRHLKPHPNFCQKNHLCFDNRYTMCPPLENHPFQNQECSRNEDMAKDNWLHCLTRSDAQNSLFKKVVFKKIPKSPNLNDQLKADETGFWCNTTADQHFLAWNSSVKRIGGYGDLSFCLLKDNTNISNIELSRLLKNDISFEFHSNLTGWNSRW